MYIARVRKKTGQLLQEGYEAGASYAPRIQRPHHIY